MIRTLSIAAVAAAVLVSPAAARESGCVAAPQVRAAAATAPAEQQQKALRAVATAEKLCEAGNDRAGKQKIEVAMKALGLDEAKISAASAPAASQ